MDDRVTMRWPWLALVAACSCILGILAGVLTFPQARALLPGGSATAAVGGPFRLIDQTGRIVTDRDFRGRPMLVMFGFINDPDQTPAGLQTVASALDALGTRADRLTVLFVTLDPTRDTPQELAAHLARYHARITGLSGTAEDIAAVARSYRLPVVRHISDTPPNAPVINFDSLIFLMNSQGLYVSHMDLSETHATLIHKLKQVL
jgi:protein SCO1